MPRQRLLGLKSSLDDFVAGSGGQVLVERRPIIFAPSRLKGLLIGRKASMSPGNPEGAAANSNTEITCLCMVRDRCKNYGLA